MVTGSLLRRKIQDKTFGILMEANLKKKARLFAELFVIVIFIVKALLNDGVDFLAKEKGSLSPFHCSFLLFLLTIFLNNTTLVPTQISHYFEEKNP